MSNSDGQWVTIPEASQIIGRSENAVRLLVKRRKFDQLKKVQNKGRGKWVIHREAIDRWVNSGLLVKYEKPDQSNHDLSIPLKHYEEQRKEWLQERDQLQSGLMMYRYKFEELERQIKILPAPVEMVNAKLTDLQTLLQEADVDRAALTAELEQERKRSWWKKVLGMR